MAEIKSYPNNADEYIGAEPVMRWHHGRTSGVFAADTNCAVSAVTGEMAVNVSDGIGWLADAGNNGIVWWNDNFEQTAAQLELAIDTADGTQSRIDRVIVEWSTPNYTAKPELKILKGVNAVMPTAPALTNNVALRQISLAQVLVAAGTLAITSAMITDERLDKAVCGLVTEDMEIDTTTMQAQFAALLEAIEQELNDLNAGTAVELKRIQVENTTVPTTAFVADTTYADYPYRAAVPITGVLASMTPEVTYGVVDALSGIYAPVSECYAGGVYIYAAEVPEANVVIPTIIAWKAVT